VAFWFHAAGRDEAAGRTTWGLSLLAAGLIGSGIALGGGRHWSSDYLLGLGYAALLAATLRSAGTTGPRRLGRVMEWRPLVWVGTVSYSLYLTHPLVAERGLQLYHRFVKSPGPLGDALAVVALLAGILAVGAAFYRLVERLFVRSVDAAPAPAGATAAAPAVATGMAAAAS
jgi:peptidoglycan/LPS O-acetylase OafA/YrhL